MSLASRDRPRMRIAFVYDAMVPYCLGGAERRFHELATRLAIRHDVHYVTWRYWGDDPILIRDGITYHGVGTPKQFYGKDGRRTVREQLAFAAAVPRALLHIEPEVVDISATPFPPVYTAWLGTRLTRTPLIATWHEYWGEHWGTYLHDRPVVARLARIAEAAARPLADRRVAVSPFTARRLVEPPEQRSRSGWRDAVDIVGNGVDLQELADAGSTPPDARATDVIFVGRLIAEKRVDVLLHAIARVAEARPWIRCDVVGDGPERAPLMALVSELDLAANVTFTGRIDRDELTARLGAARILAMPSAREGYGITVVEGQAAGAVPIVARGPLSAAADLVNDDVDGLVVDGTVEAFATAIGGLLDEPGDLDRLSVAARSTAATRGWDDRATELERVYASMVLGRRKTRARRRKERGHPAEAGNWSVHA